MTPDETEAYAVATPPVGGLSAAPEDDPRVIAALELFLSETERGRRPDRRAFLAAHAEVAGVLASCLDGLDLVRRAARHLNPSSLPASIGPLGPGVSRLLGDFRILREVGRGGMGVVYEAEQVSLCRRVALKILPFAAALDPRQRQRFQTEAQAAACLNHPHIVSVYAVGCEDGVHYYAMRFVAGQSLAAVVARLRQSERAANPTGKGLVGGRDGAAAAPTPSPSVGGSRPPPAPVYDPTLPTPLSSTAGRAREYYRTVARLGVQAAQALEHAHEQGVLHRDIKPSNLILDANGDIWVTDFGLARLYPVETASNRVLGDDFARERGDGNENDDAIGADSSSGRRREDGGLTATGDLVGTLRYMSPEQAAARPGVVDHRSDIYSLGATLYELLTLEPVFDGKTRHELLRQVALEEPRPPRRVRPSVPRELETIVLKATAKDPALRYATARELGDDLNRFLDDQPIRARRPTALEHVAKWSRRHRVVVATTVGVVVVALTVGAALVLREKQNTEEAYDELNNAYRMTFDLSDRVSMQAMGMLSGGPVGSAGDSTFYRTALSYYERIARKTEGDPGMRAVTATAYYRIGFIRMTLGDSLAEDAFRRSHSLFDELVKLSPRDPSLRKRLVEVLWQWAEMLRRTRGFDSSEPKYREALARLWGRLKEGETFDDLEQLTSYQLTFAEALHAAGRGREADALRRDLLAHYERGDTLATSREQKSYMGMAYKSLGTMLLHVGRERDARRALVRSLDLAPEDSVTMNNLAWIFVMSRDPMIRDPARALALAKRAVELEPTNGMYWNTLGVAHGRLGDWPACESALRKSMGFRAPSGDARDWFFLALALWHQAGDDEARRNAARRWYNRAVDQLEVREPFDPELRLFYDDARKVFESPERGTYPDESGDKPADLTERSGRCLPPSLPASPPPP